QVAVMVGEIVERARGSELLALEQLRNRGAQQEESGQRPQAAGARQLVETATPEGVRHLIVGLEVVDEAPGPEIERVGAPGLGLPAVPLPLIEVSPLDAGHQLLGPTAVVAQVGLAPAGGGDEGAVVEVVV